MVIHEAQSLQDEKQEILRAILAVEMRRIFGRDTLPDEKEWVPVIGTIGERGGGKSGSDAVLSIIDYALDGKDLRSNMLISCDMEVDDDIARSYGLNSGGVVNIRSKPLDKNALLTLDDSYRNTCIVIEEINVQYSNVRRFMSNTNVDFNEVCQQIRKLQSPLIYNVIDEMFIDPQLRSNTDIFIKTYDTAFDTSNLLSSNRKARGKDFMWKVYPMSAYLYGEQNRYVYTKKTKSVCFHFQPWRGVYDDMKHQEKGIYSMSTKDKNKLMISAESSPEMAAYMSKWETLTKVVVDLVNAGEKEIRDYELFDMANIATSDEIEADEYLRKALRVRSRDSHGIIYYILRQKLAESLV